MVSHVCASHAVHDGMRCAHTMIRSRSLEGNCESSHCGFSLVHIPLAQVPHATSHTSWGNSVWPPAGTQSRLHVSPIGGCASGT